MNILIISGSLNPNSRSRVLAQNIMSVLKTFEAQTMFMDLKDYPLPLCDGDAAYSDPNVIVPLMSSARLMRF